MFKIGDKVRCIQPKSEAGPAFDLSDEVLYTVASYRPYADRDYGSLDLDESSIHGYTSKRFVLVTNTLSPQDKKFFSYREAAKPAEKKADGGSSDYYLLPADAKELGDLIEHKSMNFNVGNIFKAAYRLGGKPGVSQLYDLNKIKWFVEREIARVEKGSK